MEKPHFERKYPKTGMGILRKTAVWMGLYVNFI